MKFIPVHGFKKCVRVIFTNNIANIHVLIWSETADWQNINCKEFIQMRIHHFTKFANTSEK